MKRTTVFIFIGIASLFLIGASAEKTNSVDQKKSTDRTFQRNTAEVNLAPVVKPEAQEETGEISATSGSAAAFQLNWYSINGGGVTNATSTNYQVGLSVGQSVAGQASSANYDVGIGFWYGATGGGGSCPIQISGDVNESGALTSADIIYMVNFVFKGQAAPLPCEANGDVNCSGAVTSADIIYMVNHVFKGQAAPCDICNDPNAQACV